MLNIYIKPKCYLVFWSDWIISYAVPIRICITQKPLSVRGLTESFVLFDVCCFPSTSVGLQAIHLHWRATNQSSRRNGLQCTRAKTEFEGRRKGKQQSSGDFKRKLRFYHSHFYLAAYLNVDFLKGISALKRKCQCGIGWVCMWIHRGKCFWLFTG